MRVLGRPGGPGPSSFDPLTALENWVEKGEAPDRLSATKPLPGGGTRSRPICLYPSVAQWDGSGDTDDAGSFSCVDPDPREVVATSDGTVRGVVGEISRSFYQIPYGQAPVGPLRWQPPVRSARWSDVRDATVIGSGCARYAGGS